jgi:hypothetical protein
VKSEEFIGDDEGEYPAGTGQRTAVAEKRYRKRWRKRPQSFVPNRVAMRLAVGGDGFGSR